MSRVRKQPQYLLHKPTGQARVRIGGKDHYLGTFGSADSKQRYQDLIRKWAAGKEQAALITMGVLCLRYLEFAKGYYQKDGAETSEISAIMVALRYITEQPELRNMPVPLFRTAALQKLREKMITNGIVRKSINCHVNRIRRMFTWGVSQELVAPDQLVQLRSLSGLRAGRSSAIESKPVLPVDQARIDAVRDHVRPRVWAMVQLQLLTGMRPGEVRTMRWRDIDKAGDVWEYRPARHKTEHHGRARRVFIGKQGQDILAEYLSADQDRFIFESVRGKCYGKDSYAKAIRRACEEAEIESWHPNQLRHNAATELRRAFGIEAARTVLGHSNLSTTEIYAEADFDQARAVIGKIG